MGNIHAVGPNEALVISGGCCGNQKVRKIVGKWGWAWWFVTEVQRLSLSVMTLNPICENVETSEGVPLSVTGVAQIKVMRNDDLLSAACEQFLGKDRDEIENTILQTLEGHLRAILGTLSVEEIYSDRDQFALLVREVAAPDVGRMGIEILSFTIKDVYDKVEYLDSLGITQISSVKRDADIGVALAERDAGIREAECEKTRENARFDADTIIAECRKDFELKKAEFDSQVNTAKAECELAYQLQEAKERQKIRNEEIQIDMVKKKKEIELEDQEILRNEKSLDATVKVPAEAEAYRLEQLAEGEKIKKILAAQAQAEAIRLKGLAEADAIVAVGNAEAEGMRLKATAYSKYGKAAMLSQVLETMPRIAAEICSPLAKVDEIVLLGGNNGNGDVSGLLKAGSDLTNLCGTFPPAVKALTGVDLSKVMGKVPGAMMSQQAN